VETLVRIAGYDERIVARLEPREARFFFVTSGLAIAASLLASLGLAYGAWLAFRSVPVAFVGAFVAGPVVLNLFRMHHAGTGYSIHLPIAALELWRPSWAAPLVFFALGAMLLQPLALLALKPATDRVVAAQIAEERAELQRVGGDVRSVTDDGLIRRARATWDRPAQAGVLTALLALFMAAPALGRVFWARSVRAYERERWIGDRMFVDDAFADAQDLIHRALLEEEHYSGRLQLHFADPPYNTQPIFFGIDPRVVERDGVRFVKPENLEEEPPPPVEEPAGPPPTPEEKAAAPDEEALPENEPLFAWDDALDTGDPPEIAYLDIGRLPARVARNHPDEVASFVVAFTGRDEKEVRDLLRVAPDEMPIHRLYSEWTRLPTILMKDAGFATDHGLSRIISIIVDKPVDEVERRLRAAPRDRRLTGVFTSELARRILGKKVPPRS
jgi:hypothetical protein